MVYSQLLPLEKKMKEDGSILVFDLAKPSDVEEVFEGLLTHFFVRTPVRQIQLFDESDETRRPLWKLEVTRQCCTPPKGLSITVREKSTGLLVAFAGATIEQRSELPEIAPPLPVEDRSAGWLARALDAELYRELNPYVMYDAEQILLIDMVFVVPNYGRCGISSELFKFLLDVGVSRGVKVGMGSASGHYSSKSVVKAGGRIVRSLDYVDFTLPDGSKPFTGVDMGDHKTRNLFVLIQQ